MKSIILEFILLALFIAPVYAGQIAIYRHDGGQVIGDIDRRSGTVLLNDMGTGQVTTGYIDRQGNATLFQGPGFDNQPLKTPNLDALPLSPGMAGDDD